MLFLTFLAYPLSAQTLTINNGSAGANWTLSAPSSTITAAGKNYEHIETTGLAHTLLKVNAALVWSVSIQQSGTATGTLR